MAKSQDHDARWDDVRVFLAAYRDGTLGLAARHLGLDVSTVSRRLAAFEAALDTRLFDRTRQGLEPLAAAELLLPAAEAMDAAHARLTREAAAVEAEPEGIVRLSVAPGMADTFVTPALAEFRRRYPRITVELDASVRPVDLTRHHADLALRSIRPTGADLLLKRLTASRWVAAIGATHARRIGELARWEDVPWIAWDRDLASLPAARWLATHVPKAEIALRTSHFASQIVGAAEGIGAILVPDAFLDAAPLAPLDIGPSLEASAEAWPVDDLWLVGHRALREVPRVDALWTFLAGLDWSTATSGAKP